MKPNIDLTDGRDFQDRPQEPRDVLFGVPYKVIPQVTLPTWATSFTVHLVPWELHRISSDDDFLYSDNFDPLFPTGNRSEIVHRKGVFIACSDKHCDRCGSVINVIPWGTKLGLCDKCRDALEREVGGNRAKEMPWERNPNTITMGDLLW
jgi:hypothetical protein